MYDLPLPVYLTNITKVKIEKYATQLFKLSIPLKFFPLLPQISN